MARLLLVLVFLIQAVAAVNAEVFHCEDGHGKTIFQDSECSSDETLIENFTDVEAENIVEFNNANLGIDNSLRVIYEGSKFGSETRFVKVSIVEETDEYLLLEVVGYFSGSPKGKMQFRAVPNMKWNYTGDVHATKRGFIKEYTRISLNSTAKDRVKSDIFTLQLWHYSPKNKATRLKMLTVPFKKTWVKKRR